MRCMIYAYIHIYTYIRTLFGVEDLFGKTHKIDFPPALLDENIGLLGLLAQKLKVLTQDLGADGPVV